MRVMSHEVGTLPADWPETRSIICDWMEDASCSHILVPGGRLRQVPLTLSADGRNFISY